MTEDERKDYELLAFHSKLKFEEDYKVYTEKRNDLLAINTYQTNKKDYDEK